MEGLMAKVIEFCFSEFWPTRSNYLAPKEGGKLIEFRSPKRNQVNSHPLTGQQYMVYVAPFAANLRAVEPATPREQCTKKGVRSRRGTSVRSAGSFVRPDLTFDFCEGDGDYRLTVVA